MIQDIWNLGVVWWQTWLCVSPLNSYQVTPPRQKIPMIATRNHTSSQSSEKGLLSISLSLSLICNTLEWLPLPDTSFPRALNTLKSSRPWTQRLTTPRGRANWASSCLNFSINRSTRDAEGKKGRREEGGAGCRLVHLAALVRSLHWNNVWAGQRW